MDFEAEKLIKDRAYKIWELEGRPDGRDFEHWTQAKQEIGAVMAEPETPAKITSKAKNNNTRSNTPRKKTQQTKPAKGKAQEIPVIN